MSFPQRRVKGLALLGIQKHTYDKFGCDRDDKGLGPTFVVFFFCWLASSVAMGYGFAMYKVYKNEE